MGSYPLVLDLAGRRAVVVGGGAVALRRVRGLLAAGRLGAGGGPGVLPELAALPVSVSRGRTRTGTWPGPGWCTPAPTTPR